MQTHVSTAKPWEGHRCPLLHVCSSNIQSRCSHSIPTWQNAHLSVQHCGRCGSFRVSHHCWQPLMYNAGLCTQWHGLCVTVLRTRIDCMKKWRLGLLGDGNERLCGRSAAPQLNFRRAPDSVASVHSLCLQGIYPCSVHTVKPVMSPERSCTVVYLICHG